MEAILKQLPEVLLPWYEENKRSLPWREDRQPYHVWVSEIMLQQTRAEAVKGYYARFLKELPTVQDLAACDDDKLHKLWEGLGYYSRVRNLKKAAQQIVERWDGRFPADYESILALPGVGEYTAGAVCSICYDLPTPAVDGNVLRVLSRLLSDDTPIDLPAQKKSLSMRIAGVYPARAGDFTQALMELGATLCGPNREPDCFACPCRSFCLGCKMGTAAALPVKGKKKERRIEEKTVLILRCQGRYGLCKRPNSGLLAGLWQFPDVPGTLDLPQAQEAVRGLGLEVSEVYRQREEKHIFTHVQWNMRGWYLEVKEAAGALQWVDPAQLEAQYALPTAYRQFWEDSLF